MSKADKLLTKLLGRPKDFTYSELKTVLGHLGYQEVRKGKTGGSRRAFVHQRTKHIIRLHKPHPGNEMKHYQIKEVIAELTKNGLI